MIQQRRSRRRSKFNQRLRKNRCKSIKIVNANTLHENVFRFKQQHNDIKKIRSKFMTIIKRKNNNKNIVFISNNDKCYEFNIDKRFENEAIKVE